MPIECESATTAKGTPYLRTNVFARVTLADAQQMEVFLLPGQPLHGGPVFSVVAKATEYDPDARKFFVTLSDKYGALAAVVTSPIVRAAINLMLRLNGSVGAVRMFTNEDEALAWLEDQPRISASPPTTTK